MPNRSNVSDWPSFDRAQIGESLYTSRGSKKAAHRCEVNQALGDFDLLQTLVETLKLRPGETLYDVGCGSGQHLMRYAECVHPGGVARGFDSSPEAVAGAKSRGVEATVADLAKLPVDASSADAITCTYAVYYHGELAEVIAEWKRVLKSGGRLVVSGPSFDSNRELYAFHQEVTGAEPSDADRMALGYVETTVREALEVADFENIGLELFSNSVRFPDAASFLEYWGSTSLFLRTPGASLDSGVIGLAEARAPFVVTKRVAVLSAQRP